MRIYLIGRGLGLLAPESKAEIYTSDYCVPSAIALEAVDCVDWECPPGYFLTHLYSSSTTFRIYWGIADSS